MSSRVKQANFRLPLEYMHMIDEFAERDGLTKAGVITRALDCMKASYDSGNGGMPVKAGNNAAEIKNLKNELDKAQKKIAQLEQNRNGAIGANGNGSSEVAQLQAIITAQEATIRDKDQEIAAKDEALAAKSAEIVSSTMDGTERDALIREKDARIAALEQRVALGGNGYGNSSESAMSALAIDAEQMTGDEGAQAIQLFNMLSGVMGAFKQQVEDARMLGIQEGRKAVNTEFRDILGRARNDGYREAMSYLDERCETARDMGAKEERARIANMRFFDRRRYLKIHLI